MSEKIIDMKHWFDQQKIHQQKFVAAEADLAKKHKDLVDLERLVIANVVVPLQNGATTGNLLHDEIIKAFGPNEEFVRKISALNQCMIDSQGQELLLVCDHKLDSLPSGGWEKGYIFGILSGNRLSFQYGSGMSNLVLHLPLRISIVSGFNHHYFNNMLKQQPLKGICITDDPMSSPNVKVLVRALVGKPDTNFTSSFIWRFSIHIGENEIREYLSKSYCLISPEEIDSCRRRLRAD